MAARDFLRGSSLRWSHDGGGAPFSCKDHEIAAEGQVNALWLRHGVYGHQTSGGWPRCRHEGRRYFSNERTRPRDGVAGQEGFYLNLDNSLRPGSGADAPVYFQYRRHRYVTYWFLYGFNDSGREVGNHEGDWEQISVRLDDKDRATEVAFYGHGTPHIRPWSQLLYFDGHPIVYSANGSHASYWKIGEFDRKGPGVVSGKDYTSGAGPIWKTWNRLVRVKSQPWYGYGGAWGEVGASRGVLDKETTGPLGPSRYKEPAPSNWR